MNALLGKLTNSTLFKSSLIYSFFGILNAVGPFILLPVLSHHLSTEEYGYIAMFSVLISFITPIMGLGINTSLPRFFYSLENKEFIELISICLYFVLITLVPILCISYILREFIYQFTSLSYYRIAFALVISACQFIHSLCLYYWQVKQKPIAYGLFQLGYILLNLSLSLYFVLLKNYQSDGRIYGWLLSALTMSLIAVIILLRQNLLVFSFPKAIFQQALSFSSPLIFHNLGGFFLNIIDRVIINRIIGLDGAGIYAIAYQIGSIFNVFLSACNTAYTPWLFSTLNSNKDTLVKRKIVGLTYVSFIAILVFVIIFSVCATFLFPYFVGNSFAESKTLLPIIFLGFGLGGMYLLVANFIFYAQKTALIAQNTILLGFLNCGICYLFISNFGLKGAAIAMCVANFILFLSNWFISNSVYKMPWKSPLLKT
ncbi:lipopolysaccharide biosynthesis protein [Aquirufa sp. Wall-65K1]